MTIWNYVSHRKVATPSPLVLETELYLKAITGIDEGQNSISIQAELWCYWGDPGLALSDNSADTE